MRIPEDLAPYPFKTNFMPHLIIEHLAKTPGNKTLVVYGDGLIRYRGNNFMGDIEAALGRGELFVVGRIGELRSEERGYLAAVGDPDKPFFVESRRFPTTIPWPASLRTSLEERPEHLADYIDAFVYLGPEPDRLLTGSIPLSAAQQSELDRRLAIMSDPQRTMRVRYQGRNQWFRAHPNDVPPAAVGIPLSTHFLRASQAVTSADVFEGNLETATSSVVGRDRRRAQAFQIRLKAAIA